MCGRKVGVGACWVKTGKVAVVGLVSEVEVVRLHATMLTPGDSLSVTYTVTGGTNAPLK